MSAHYAFNSQVNKFIAELKLSAEKKEKMNTLIKKFDQHAATMNSKSEQTALLATMKSCLTSWEVKVDLASKCKSASTAARLCAASHAMSE